MDADTILKRRDMLRSQRAAWEPDWRAIIKYAAPQLAHAVSGASGLGQTIPVTGSARGQVVDNTAHQALDTLVAGMDGLVFRGDVINVTPRGEATLVPGAAGWAQAAKQVLDGAVNHRNSGWPAERMKALRSTCALGIGAIETSEVPGEHLRYSAIPVGELLISDGSHMMVDTVFRSYRLDARTAMREFGDRCPEKIVQKAESDPFEKFDFVHAVFPAEDDDDRPRVAGWRYVSYHVFEGEKAIVRQAGYTSHCYGTGRWQRMDGTPYGWSPVMGVMDEIKRINVMVGDNLFAARRMIKPVTYARGGLFNGQPDTRPGMFLEYRTREAGDVEIRKWPGPDGLPFLMEMEEQVRNAIRTGMFYFLIQQPRSPDMTATEWLGRVAEMYRQLSGPAAQIARELGDPAMTRSLDLLIQAGVIDPPPPPLGLEHFNVSIDPPIAKMEAAQRLDQLMRFLQTGGTIMQMDPQSGDLVSFDQVMRFAHEYCDIPMEILLPDEIVQLKRQARAQQAQQQRLIEAAEPVAGAAEKFSRAAQNAGLIPSGNGGARSRLQ